MTRPETTSARPHRGWWPMRDLPLVGWLVAAGVIALVHPWVPAPRWLLIHLVLLGAAGHAILVWSRYFADTLVHAPTSTRREQTWRLVLFNAGVVTTVIGVPGEWLPVVIAGATAVGVAVLWHVYRLLAGVRVARGSRFGFVLGYYLAAGCLLPVGAGLGSWLASGMGDPFSTQLRIAHLSINLLGWVGLTVLGTLVSLWPTMLRTRMPEAAERAARGALPVLLAGLALVQVGVWTELLPVAAAGVLGYLAGVLVLDWSLWRAFVVKPPTSFPTMSVAAGMVWLVLGLLVLGVTGLTADDWLDWGARFDWVVPFLVVGFLLQVLLGALTYLVPVVIGGGPAATRSLNAALGAGGTLRVTLVNAGLLVWALPVGAVARVVSSTLVLLALASFVPILLVGMARRRRLVAGAPDAEESSPRLTNGSTLGVAVLALGVAVAAGISGTLGGGGGADAVPIAADVQPTGRVVTVDIEAANMRFTPDTIKVNAGDRLVITVTNADPGDVHDLVLDDGTTTGRLAPGERAKVDVGVVGRDVDGWCSILGHRQMGMVLTITIGEGGSAGHGMAHGSGSHADQSEAESGGSEVGTGSAAAYPPALPPLTNDRVRRLTLTVTEQVVEVEPGIRQEVWTYNGSAPGPVLHGRVGDRFVITLVNRGTMGHSIDFHAGERAPDKVMRTIPPGESLTYRFTARRAGIWMYHCSTMPMSAHIAAGLYGAVVIEPPDLPAVDQSFVLVQAEQYFGDDGQPVDVDKVNAEAVDRVVFNGRANQYADSPLRVRSGERIRIWVLDAGPNRPSAFHVVGGQFDAVYFEGGWQLGDPTAKPESGGSQVLGLHPAQGGFVELTFTEPGRYPFVSHLMVDAERGAHGVIEVAGVGAP